MILTEPQVQSALQRAAAAFPRFLRWEYHNEINESYPGFSLWGEFHAVSDELPPRQFFVTFDTFGATWRGTLSIGQPCYFWSSANVGDAYLADTERCATLEDAITGLQREIANLFTAFSGAGVELDQSGSTDG